MGWEEDKVCGQKLYEERVAKKERYCSAIRGRVRTCNVEQMQKKGEGYPLMGQWKWYPELKTSAESG